MQLSVSGRYIDVGDALRGHVAASLAPTVDRYSGSAIEAKVLFAREWYLFHAEITAHIARGMLAQSHGEATDACIAFNRAVERLETRLQRCKGRLIGRRKSLPDSGERTETARHYMLAADAGENAENPERGRSAIGAELAFDIAALTVDEAVMRLDPGDLPILMFRNHSHDRLNVIYRRSDGTVGWIDLRSSPVVGTA